MPKYTTDHQNALFFALKDMNDAAQEKWGKVVEVVNSMRESIDEGTEYFAASFPPDLERMFDEGAEKTAWIYGRLESASKGNRRNTRTKIRRALGYHTNTRKG